MHRLSTASAPRLRPDIRAAGLAVLVAAIVVACSSGPGGPPEPSGGPIDVVATTTVFSDLVGQVGGSHVRSVSLVPRGGDVHTFEPRPADVQTIARGRSCS